MGFTFVLFLCALRQTFWDRDDEGYWLDNYKGIDDWEL